MVTSEVLVSTI